MYVPSKCGTYQTHYMYLQVPNIKRYVYVQITILYIVKAIIKSTNLIFNLHYH